MKAKYSSPVEAARDLIKKHGITDIPVDIESLCRDEGIKIIYTDFTKLEESVGKKISGLIQNNMIIYQAQPPSYRVPIHSKLGDGQIYSFCYTACSNGSRIHQDNVADKSLPGRDKRLQYLP